MGHALGTLKRFLLLTGLYYAGAVIASLYLRTPEDVTLFWPSAGLGFAVVGAVIGTIGLVHSGMVPPIEAGRAWLLWALGDLLGITTIAPAMSVVLGEGGLRESLWKDRVDKREQTVWTIALVGSMIGIISAGRSGNLYALGLVS